MTDRTNGIAKYIESAYESTGRVPTQVFLWYEFPELSANEVYEAIKAFEERLVTA